MLTSDLILLLAFVEVTPQTALRLTFNLGQVIEGGKAVGWTAGDGGSHCRKPVACDLKTTSAISIRHRYEWVKVASDESRQMVWMCSERVPSMLKCSWAVMVRGDVTRCHMADTRGMRGLSICRRL